MSNHFDLGSLVVIVITFILFVLALFTKGLTHDLLLEAGVFLVSVKLILMAYKNSVSSKELLKELNITKLYPPQEEALPHALAGENIVLSIPTAAGKSLIAYLAIFHRLKKEIGKALYVVPLRALAREKYEDLKEFEKLGFKIGISTGDLDESAMAPPTWNATRSVL